MSTTRSPRLPVVWCANNDGTIMSAPRAGGTPSTVAAYFRCDEVAINGDGVYFVGGGDDNVTSRAGAHPDAPTTMGPAGLLATDAHALYIATGATGGPTDEIVRVNTAVGADLTPTPIVLGQPYITSLAVDAAGVYWTTFDGASGAVLMLAR